MTVLENVMVGCHPDQGRAIFIGIQVPQMKKEEKWVRESPLRKLEMGGLLERPIYPPPACRWGSRRTRDSAGSPTGPKLILLDEPAAGLNEAETQEMSDLVYTIRDSGVTILLVEHDMSLVMKVSDEIVVINYGQKIAEGPPEAIRNDGKVIEAYLGVEVDYA